MTFDQKTFLSSILIGGFPYDQCIFHLSVTCLRKFTSTYIHSNYLSLKLLKTYHYENILI